MLPLSDSHGRTGATAELQQRAWTPRRRSPNEGALWSEKGCYNTDATCSGKVRSHKQYYAQLYISINFIATMFLSAR